MDGGPAAPVKVNIKERQHLALMLRKQGGSYRKIAAQLREQPGITPQYSESMAHSDVMAALKELNEKIYEEAAEVRRLELERIDELLSKYYQKALAGDHNSLHSVLALMDRRAKYSGLYAPDKSVSIVIDWDKLTEDQVDRIAAGEDPRLVVGKIP